MAQGAYYTACIKDKDCHRDFFHEALGALGFPSRTVWKWREANQVENNSPEALKVGETLEFVA